MTSARTAFFPRRRRPSFRLRLLALSATPLTLAITLITPATPATSVAPPRQALTAPGAQADNGLRVLHLPGLRATGYIVTLITGAQVTLHAIGDGRYTVIATPAPGSAPGPGSAVIINAQGGPTGLTRLQAVPESVQPLISSGRVDPGLFDVRYLLSHGDTGPAARIPVVIQYTGHPSATALTRMARLPGSVPLATSPASGEAEVSVIASHAATFWAALTGQPTADSRPGATAGPAGRAVKIWLAGHRGVASTSQPDSSQAVSTLTETITRTAGPIDDGDCLSGSGKRILTAIMCGFTSYLWGVTGPAAGMTYSSPASCAAVRTAKPYPVCVAWRMTYRVPAGIYYASDSFGSFLTTTDSDHALESGSAILELPQITVVGSTAVTLNANNIRPVTVTTPKSVSGFGIPDTMETARTLPNGGFDANFIFVNNANWWALPTPAGYQSTVGSYTFTPSLTLGRRPVTASVTAPEHTAVDLIYPAYSDAIGNSSIAPNRFSGSHIFSLVNASEGTKADFSRIDARGKLALIRTQPNTLETVFSWQLANAEHAGAAGVLIGAAGNGYGHPVPLPVQHAPSIPRDIPFAEVDAKQSATLTSLLARGNVRITVDDSGPSPYNYHLSFSAEKQIPGSLHYTVTSHQLAEVTGNYHSAARTGLVEDIFAVHPDIFLTSGSAVALAGPATLDEYYGPVSPELLWYRQSVRSGVAEGMTALFVRPKPSSLQWDEPPATPGAPAPGTAVNQAQPGQWVFCAGCRQGNTFYPYFYLVNGANPEEDYPQFGYGFATGRIHLYSQDGHELPPALFHGLVTYELAAEPTGYRLVTQDGSTSTTWDFTSAAPGTDQTPAGTLCLGTYAGVSTQPCDAPPLVFLRYNAFTSLTDSVSAPGVHRIEVTAYHQAPGAPPIVKLRLWISTNGGKSWRLTPAAGRDGRYQAFYTVPPLASTNGYLSIKAQATDAAGNNIAQTVLTACSLSKPGART